MDDSAGVIDASVLMAAMLREISPTESAGWIKGSCISAVNMSEVVAKFADRGAPTEAIADWIADFSLDVRPFTAELAFQAGNLRPATRAQGLSFGDRACLALAKQLGRPAITADRAWADLDCGVPITVIR